jgi:hypothetical protein
MLSSVVLTEKLLPGRRMMRSQCARRGRQVWKNASASWAGDWARTAAAQRVMAASTGILSERGFTGWGGARVGEAELEDELRWMAALEASGKRYYSINEVQAAQWSDDWVNWVLACFLLGKQPGSALWLGTVQGYGNWSHTSAALSAPVGQPVGPYTRDASSGALLRHFTKAVVVVNPSVRRTGAPPN